VDLKRLVVGEETVRMLDLGHPWVIADRFTRRWPGGLRCGELALLCAEDGRELATALLEPGDRVAARILSRKPLPALSRRWFEERLSAARKLRQEHLDLEGTTAFRLVNGEGDGLPGLTVDAYGRYLLVQSFSRSWECWLEPLQQALGGLFQPQGICLKLRPQETRKLAGQSDLLQHRLLAGGIPEGRLTVQENGLNFLVELRQGLHTGLFLDQRDNRRDFMRRCQGKRVLNLFAFTGAFSVAAAAAGAREVATVDASANYLDWARENFSANRLNPKRHRFLEGDCGLILEQLAGDGARFDLVLMDPPSFSTTRRGKFTTRGGTSDLVAAALGVLEPGGLLVTSSNHQKVDIADYLKELRRGALQAGSGLQVIGLWGQGGDFPYSVGFPEGRYLKYVMAVKGGG